MNTVARLFTNLAIITACTFATSIASAEIYKWTDETGRVHYSDKKPKQDEFDEMRVSTGKGTPGAQQQASTPAADTAEKEQELQAKADALSGKESAEETKNQCENVRMNLEKITNNPRIRINDGGQMRYLTPDEIEDRKEQYTQLLEEFCQ